jgi:outer membrane protein TolC
VTFNFNMRPLVFGGCLLLLPLPLLAQPAARSALPPGSPFLGGIPVGTATADPLPLSLQDAVRRALDHNLGSIVAAERLASAEGARTHAFGDLLPRLTGSVSEARRTTNLEAWVRCARFSASSVLNVFDARLFVSQAIVDRRSANDARHRARAHRDASRLSGMRASRRAVAGNLHSRRLSRIYGPSPLAPSAKPQTRRTARP